MFSLLTCIKKLFNKKSKIEDVDNDKYILLSALYEDNNIYTIDKNYRQAE